MSSKLSASPRTAHTAITRMSSSRCSTFHAHLGSSTVSNAAIKVSSMAFLQSGKAEPLAGQVAELESLISCVTPAIRSGTVTASAMLKKLSAYPRQNGLAVALRELGRLDRSLYMLRWLLDLDLRRRAQAGLNLFGSHSPPLAAQLARVSEPGVRLTVA